MLTTLWTSKSGLNANQEKLDVISNNIANVNTTGYKKVNAGFKDLISSSLDEWGNPLNDKTATVGSGVKTGTMKRRTGQQILILIRNWMNSKRIIGRAIILMWRLFRVLLLNEGEYR